MMKKLLLLIITIMLAGSTAVFADSNIKIRYNGGILKFNSNPVLVGEETMVQLRPLADAMGLKLLSENGKIVLYDAKTKVIFAPDSNKITVNDNTITMGAPVLTRDDYTFVPIRQIVELFCDEMTFDGITKTVSITKIGGGVGNAKPIVTQKKEPTATPIPTPTAKPVQKPVETKPTANGSTYYYQAQPEFALENNGRGYCWVCSYAMLMSDVTGRRITPLDVAQVNISRGYSGSFMSGHETLVAEFGCKLVPALSESSPYYAGFNAKNKGETALKVQSDDEVRAALTEALANHPKGIIVRYEGYPHSMVAIRSEGGKIYFNDPGLKNGGNVLFADTCLKSFKLSDISYIQAIVK